MIPALATQLIVFNGHVVFEDDPDTVLAAATAAGFTAVETQLEDPRRLRERLVAHGLRHAAAHVVPSMLQEPARWIDFLGITGARDLCTSGLLRWHERTAADHDATADILNRAGQAFRAAGIHLHYHHHDFEVTEYPATGKTSLAYLLDRLDPAAVDLCVDVGWLHRAGVAPAAFLTEHASRIGYLHLKDWDGTAWAPPGRGSVDFAGIVAQLPRLSQMRWIVCEQDSTVANPAECLQLARRWCCENLPHVS